MILFSAEAILASSTSKSGIRIPLTEQEDLRSSTDFNHLISRCVAVKGHVLGVLREAYPRVRCHRTLRPRGTLAWRTAGRGVRDSV